MDYLQSTDSLVFNLVEAIAAVESPVVVSYHKFGTSGITLPPVNSPVISNGTTRVTIISTDSVARQISTISVSNADTIDHTYLFQIDDGSGPFTITKILLPAGASAFWSKSSGWQINNSSTRNTYVITAYTSSGTHTVGSGCKDIETVVIGGGGGGASGRVGAAGTNRFGGGSGQGGLLVRRRINPATISGPVTVTVGSRGLGGAAVSANDTNGNNGTVGGDSSFGPYALAKGGAPGSGGTTAAGAGGSSSSVLNCVPAYGPSSLPAANGGASTTNTATAGIAGLAGNTACPGGGPGSGINTTNTGSATGGQGGGVYNLGILVTGPTTSGNGTNNASTFLFNDLTLSSGDGIGTGGAGGNSISPAGGNGGNYGAGGGGGSGLLNGSLNLNRGGDGGSGLVLVLEVY